MRKPLLLLLAAAIDALLVSATASAQHCNVLRRQPDGVPGQNPITMCLNVSSLPAGERERANHNDVGQREER